MVSIWLSTPGGRPFSALISGMVLPSYAGVGREARDGGEAVIGLAHLGQVLPSFRRRSSARVAGSARRSLILPSASAQDGQADAEIGGGAVVGILVGDHVHAFARGTSR